MLLSRESCFCSTIGKEARLKLVSAKPDENIDKRFEPFLS